MQSGKPELWGLRRDVSVVISFIAAARTCVRVLMQELYPKRFGIAAVKTVTNPRKVGGISQMPRACVVSYQ